MNCRKCGKEIPEGSLYCDICGADVRIGIFFRHQNAGGNTAEEIADHRAEHDEQDSRIIQIDSPPSGGMVRIRASFSDRGN